MIRPKLLLVVLDPGTNEAIKSCLSIVQLAWGNTHDAKIHTASSNDELLQLLECMAPEELRDLAVVCYSSSNSSNDWAATGIGKNGWGIAPRLVLSFPEVYFIFTCSFPVWLAENSANDIPSNLLHTLQRHHFVRPGDLFRIGELLALHAQGFRTLFDPTGLRTLLKSAVIEQTKRGDLYLRRLRSRLVSPVAVADEELDYCCLNALACYRDYHRVWLLSSRQEFFRVLCRTKEARLAGCGKLAAVISDWDLTFYDGTESDYYASAAKQGEGNLLADAFVDHDEPILIISSYPSDPGIESFLNNNRDRTRGSVLPKPVGGLHSVGGALTDIGVVTDRGGFFGSASKTPRHALPFGRSVVVGALMQRAQGMASRDSIVDCVHVALLTIEARDLLGQLSRTTCYEAMARQHIAEVTAEVARYATASSVDCSARLDELDSETDLLAVCDRHANITDERSHESRVDFLMKLTQRLRKLYGDWDQVNAAEECLARLATKSYRLGGQSERGLTGLASLYVNWVTKSGGSIYQILFANILFVIFFGLVFTTLLFIHPRPGTEWWHNFYLGFGHSAFSFFELQPGVSEYEAWIISERLGYWLIGCYRISLFIEIVIAYIKLGLFISLVYRKLTRHAP